MVSRHAAAGRASQLREEGIRRSGHVEDVGHQARWVDPDAVYVWPTETAASDWIAYLKGGGYGGRLDSQYEIVAVNARPDELVVSPDNEDFGGFIGAWAADRYSGEPWPTPDDSDSADFYQSLRQVSSADGLTLGDWLDEHGDGVYWAEDDLDDDEDESDELDERIVASRMVRELPADLRQAVCEHYAAHSRALMLFSAIPASRVVDIDD